MDNRQASEWDRFYLDDESSDEDNAFICEGDAVRVFCTCDPVHAEFIMAALNAADAREKGAK